MDIFQEKRYDAYNGQEKQDNKCQQTHDVLIWFALSLELVLPTLSFYSLLIV